MQMYKIKAKLQNVVLFLVFLECFFRLTLFDKPLFFPNFAMNSIFCIYTL